MKKFYFLSILAITSFSLAACSASSSSITSKELQKNDWIGILPDDSEEQTISFTKDKVLFYPDYMFINYTIDENKMTWKGKSKEETMLFIIKKSGDNIILKPDPSSYEDLGIEEDEVESNIITLKPMKGTL